MSKKLILSLPLFFTLSLTACNDDPVIKVENNPVEYSLLNIINKDNNNFAAMKSKSNGKVYLMNVSENCPVLSNINATNTYTFINQKWVTKSGKKGSAIIDSNNVLCNNSINKNQSA
jgi:hypothetical protein